MRFSIGYQLPDENDSVPSIVADYPGQVAEVYFALAAEPSGRSPLTHGDGWHVEEAWDAMLADLAALSQQHLNLTLLLNASCYGSKATSYALGKRIDDAITRIRRVARLNAVTTMSPYIAQLIKQHYPDMLVYASINMRIGSVVAMEQLAQWFDGYYLKREYNRSPEIIDELYQWCAANGKALRLLANSGCLYDCAFQQFHDNLVAHEKEVSQENGPPVRYPAPCWEYLHKQVGSEKWLQNTWIRPEDIHHYQRWFTTVKLATRMHSNPRLVLGAYVRGRHRGNLLDLFEPGHAPLLGNYILDNSRFPQDWHQCITSCNRQCSACGYCADVMKKVYTQRAV